MRDAAAAALYAEMVALEGRLNYLYFDTVNLATTGIGSMIDSGWGLTSFGRTLPWRTKAGEYATEVDANNEYTRLKALGINKQGGRAYETYASLFLDWSVVDWMFIREIASMENTVAGFLSDWADLRADAQLAAMSMAYNVGPNMFNPSSSHYWPNLSAALKSKDYLKASDNCLINGQTSERNRRNRKMFLQCVRADLVKADPGHLFGAAVRPSAHMIAGANPTSFSDHGWWAQVLLREAKTYTGPLDGLFGPMSLAAWKKGTGETTPTLAGLQKLCDQSQWTLGIEAGA